MEYLFRIPLTQHLQKALVIDIVYNLNPLPKYEFTDDSEYTIVKLNFENEQYKNEFLEKLRDNKINVRGAF